MADENQISPKILPAITSVIAIGMGIFAARLGLSPEAVVIGSGGAATLIVAYLQYRLCKAAKDRVKKAETLVPGITDPSGPIARHTVITNNPETSDPPVVKSSHDLEI